MRFFCHCFTILALASAAIGQQIEVVTPQGKKTVTMTGDVTINATGVTSIVALPPALSFNPAAPGPIGGTTPGTGAFTTLSFNTSLFAPGAAGFRIMPNVSGFFEIRDAGQTMGAFLGVDASNTLALRNGVNGQQLNLYSSYTDIANWSRIELSTYGGPNWYLNATQTGLGEQKGLYFGTAGAPRFGFSTAGHFLAATDNVYDIGASGANRPRNIYASNVIAAPVIQGITPFDAISVGGNNPGDSVVTLSGPGAEGITIRSTGRYGFAGSTGGAAHSVSDTNLSRQAAGVLQVGTGNTLNPNGSLLANRFLFVANVTSAANNGSFDGTTLSFANQAFLTYNGANLLSQRNGASAQTFSVYRTYTDESNYSRVSIDTTNASSDRIYNFKAGSPVVKGLDIAAMSGAAFRFGANNLFQWGVDTSGHLIPQATNTYDLGSATNKVRNLYLAGSVEATGLKFSTDPAQLLSSTGNVLLELDDNTSAVNYVRIANAIAGNSPVISVQGSGTDLDMHLTPKGAGFLKFNGAAQYKFTAALGAGFWLMGQDGLTKAFYGTDSAAPDTYTRIYSLPAGANIERTELATGNKVYSGTIAANNLQLNAPVGTITQLGGGTNADIAIVPKGTGQVSVTGNLQASGLARGTLMQPTNARASGAFQTFVNGVSAKLLVLRNDSTAPATDPNNLWDPTNSQTTVLPAGTYEFSLILVGDSAAWNLHLHNDGVQETDLGQSASQQPLFMGHFVADGTSIYSFWMDQASGADKNIYVSTTNHRGVTLRRIY